MQVLLHGCFLSEQNIDAVLDGIRRDLEKTESSLANSVQDVIPGHGDVSVIMLATSLNCTWMSEVYFVYCSFSPIF